MVKTTHFHCGGPWVQSMVGELRSCKSHGTVKKRKKNRSSLLELNTASSNPNDLAAPPLKTYAVLVLKGFEVHKNQLQFNNKNDSFCLNMPRTLYIKVWQKAVPDKFRMSARELCLKTQASWSICTPAIWHRAT